MKEKEIIKEIIISGANDLKGLEKAKRKIMKKYKSLAPSNVKLLQKYHKMTSKEREALFLSCNMTFSAKRDMEIKNILTYGQQVSIKNDGNNSPQHKGLGKALINKAEEITHSEFGKKKIAIISATGTRNYYRKLGYRLKDTYMIKTISAS